MKTVPSIHQLIIKSWVQGVMEGEEGKAKPLILHVGWTAGERGITGYGRQQKQGAGNIRGPRLPLSTNVQENVQSMKAAGTGLYVAHAFSRIVRLAAGSCSAGATIRAAAPHHLPFYLQTCSTVDSHLLFLPWPGPVKIISPFPPPPVLPSPGHCPDFLPCVAQCCTHGKKHHR